MQLWLSQLHPTQGVGCSCGFPNCTQRRVLGAVVGFPTAKHCFFCACASGAFLYSAKTCRLNVGFDRWLNSTRKNKHATTAATIRALCSAFCIHQLRLSQLQYICMHVNVSCGFPNYNAHILVFTYIVALWRKPMSLEVLSIPTCGCCC